MSDARRGIVGSNYPTEHDKYPARVSNEKTKIKRIQMGMALATNRAHGEILDSMREIAQSQLKQLKEASRERLLNSSECAALHRLAQVFNILDSGTRREQESLDLTNMSDADLDVAAKHAESLLKSR